MTEDDADPRERFVDLPAGRFRYLEWSGSEPAVVLLHGLTAVAEVWGATVEALGPARARCLALDQRGHGQSHPRDGRCGIKDYVDDAVAVIRALDLDRPHLVGHSMGARVALVLAARYPASIRSVAIVDIGPEQWKQNWRQSVVAFEALPEAFGDEAEALAFAGSRVADSPVGTGVFLSRLAKQADGSLRWRADIDALCRTVRSHRSRNFWKEWEALRAPALFVRGGTSYEVRDRIAAEMRRRNANVDFLEFEGVSHNVPLIAPTRLAEELSRFWASAR